MTYLWKFMARRGVVRHFWISQSGRVRWTLCGRKITKHWYQVRRAFIPKIVVQIYESSPLIKKLMAAPRPPQRFCKLCAKLRPAKSEVME